MSQYHRPGWWVLYALVPLLAGLFVVEHRASLSPTGHSLAQVGIVLLIYGLVWLWLWANRLRLLWSDRGTSYQERAIAPRGAPISLPGARLAPRQTHAIDIRARDRYRRVHLRAKGRGIRKCSANFDRRSSWWSY
jgi:hypothetical protein